MGQWREKTHRGILKATTKKGHWFQREGPRKPFAGILLKGEKKFCYSMWPIRSYEKYVFSSSFFLKADFLWTCAWSMTVSDPRTFQWSWSSSLLPFCFESLNVKYMSYASFAVKSILFWYLINDHFDHLWQVAKNLSSLPFFFLTASVWEKQIRFKKNISICHIY